MNATETQGDAAWEGGSPVELVDHILKTFHRPLDTMLPYLDGLTAKVADAHADSSNLVEVRRLYALLMAELQMHMAKEEQALFPMIRQGVRGLEHGPIAVMRHEHDDATDVLTRLRALCGDYQTFEGEDDGVRELYAALASFEREMLLHIHLENDVLFPMVG